MGRIHKHFFDQKDKKKLERIFKFISSSTRPTKLSIKRQRRMDKPNTLSLLKQLFSYDNTPDNIAFTPATIHILKHFGRNLDCPFTRQFANIYFAFHTQSSIVLRY